MKKRIIAFFKKYPIKGYKPKQISKKLKISKEQDYKKLKHFLHQLVEEGVLQKKGKRFLLNKKPEQELKGTIHLSNNASYGFVILENENMGDIFIPQRCLGTALHGDYVKVSLLAKKKGKNLEGEIVEVIERKRKEVIGTLKKAKSFFFVIPDEKMIHRDIYISEDNLGNAKHGDKVVVNELEWSIPEINPEGKIKEVLGKSGSYESEIASLAREFDLPYQFPEEVIAEVESIPLEVPEEEVKNRLDLREETIFTIDPADAKDFDDAVSIEKLENGNYQVGVHIADVSHFVQPKTAVYNEAIERATSVYFVGQVIPMLPERLSNKICSLVPNEDRLTFSVIIEITPRGKLISYKIAKSIINSKKRFTYEEAQETLNNKKGDFFDELFHLNKLAKTLRKKRTRSGSINFSTPEVNIKLGKNGQPVDIKIKVTHDTNELIEEFMLLANQVVAKHIYKNENNLDLPFVYRVHDLPDMEKLQEFATFVKTLGYSFDPEAAKNSKQMQFLLDSADNTEEESLINEVAIRSMAKAVYSTNNIGHYGLGFDYYSHFTSPIRRFPDLIVHRLLFEYEKNNYNQVLSYKKLDSICEHCSTKERNSISAERESIKIKQLEFLKNKLGEDYSGVISGVTQFGIFIQLNENLAEGLVKMKDLDDDFYIYDEKTYSLTGRYNGKVYRLGDKVEVKVTRVDEQRREIDFVLLDEEENSENKKN